MNRPASVLALKPPTGRPCEARRKVGCVSGTITKRSER